MSSAQFCGFVFVMCLTTIAATSDSVDAIREIQSAIVQELNENRNLTAFEQNQRAQSLLDSLDAETREKYELWIKELREIEKERSQKVKEVILSLSHEAQQALTRIIMVQQSETLTTAQKDERLAQIDAEMSDEVRREISDHISKDQMFKKFVQNRV
uniref:DUF148 domain-containing protein n=1 Tax=Panagrellus redivivus TaxID=6233 RepID=A0A7E4UPD3_PANRE